MKSLVDNIWKCGCGALNAPYNLKCGKCDKPKPKQDTVQYN